MSLKIRPTQDLSGEDSGLTLKVVAIALVEFTQPLEKWSDGFDPTVIKIFLCTFLEFVIS